METELPLENASAVLNLGRPIFELLEREGLTDLAINEAGKVMLDTNAGWVSEDAPDLEIGKLNTLAQAIATYNNGNISREFPILSALLPNGERVQIIQEPVVAPGTISFTVRKPSKKQLTMGQYVKDGLFDNFMKNEGKKAKSQADADLLELYKGSSENPECMADFFKKAIEQHRNIAIVGDTGSGKTTFMKTLCGMIPHWERVITIEDVREIFIEDHPNRVHLLYQKGGKGQAKITPADLIAACMRMKPDRVLLAELRGSESYDFLKLLTTGHSGSITSYHAASCADAIARFVLMAKEHPEAASYQNQALEDLFFTAIDIVAHMKAIPVFDENGNQVSKRRVITEIYFDPTNKERVSHHGSK